MAASDTATSVLPVPPKPEPTVITPDLSEGSRIAATSWRRRSAVASRLARSRLPGATTRPCLSARLETAPLVPSCAGPGTPRDSGEGAGQLALSLPEKSGHHVPVSPECWDIASSKAQVPAVMLL